MLQETTTWLSVLKTSTRVLCLNAGIYNFAFRQVPYMHTRPVPAKSRVVSVGRQAH